MLIWQAVALLNTASKTVESLRSKMNELASTLPEYPVVMDMNGVGATLGPQLIAPVLHTGKPLLLLQVLIPVKMILESTYRTVCEPLKRGLPTCVKLFFRSWTVLSNDLQWMILFMPLWIKNDPKANLIMFI